MRLACAWRVGVLVWTAMIAVLFEGASVSTAAADEGVVLGGGAGVVVNGDALCTLATIGHDGMGELVGITSAHCGGVGATVAAEGAGGTVGSVAAASDVLDYAVVKFDPARVTPIADFDGFAIHGVDLNPGLGQWACKQSRATGQSCFSLRGWPDQSIYTAKAPWQPGDDGAPVTVNDLLIGMVREGSVTLPLVPPTRPEIVKISAIIDDLNAKPGPGAGFTPVAG